MLLDERRDLIPAFHEPGDWLVVSEGNVPPMNPSRRWMPAAKLRVYRARRDSRILRAWYRAHARLTEEYLYSPAQPGRFERQFIVARHWAEDLGWVR